MDKEINKGEQRLRYKIIQRKIKISSDALSDINDHVKRCS